MRSVTALRFCMLLCMVLAGTLGAEEPPLHEEVPLIRIEDLALNRVDSRLFGQFMERAPPGEHGPEHALMQGSRKLQPRVVSLLEDMHIPLIRFPGGWQVDKADWQDLIDNPPGRTGGRPVQRRRNNNTYSHEFGYDEFLRLCQDLGAEPMLVVNFEDAVAERRPLAEAVQHAAGLVAYCNAPLGAVLPEGMPDWPAIRAKNGHPEPYAVPYFQIGNEWWFYVLDWMKKNPDASPEETADWVSRCLHAYIDGMRAVDPAIKIIIEGRPSGIAEIDNRILDDPDLEGKVDYLTRHQYVPWAIRSVSRDGEPVEDIASLSAEELWYAWVGTPGIDPRSGESRVSDWNNARAHRRGWKIAATEWNWNGWWNLDGDAGTPALDSSLAKGLGAAGFLHGFIRDGDIVAIGCQSMLVGSNWGITAIRVDPTGEHPAFPLPTGQVTGLYSRHHGRVRLRSGTEHVPSYRQPIRMGGIRPAIRVTHLDVVVTADEQALYVHMINRHFSEDLTTRLDLGAFGDLAGHGEHHVLTGRLEDEPQSGEPLAMAAVSVNHIDITRPATELTVPRRSVSVLVIPHNNPSRLERWFREADTTRRDMRPEVYISEPEADPDLTFTSVSLVGHTNRSRSRPVTGWIGLHAPYVLDTLADGDVVIGGVPFTILEETEERPHSILALRGRERFTELPESIGPVPIGHAAASLHFLHTSAWQSREPGAPAWQYEIRYADEAEPSVLVVPVRSGIDVADWVGDSSRLPPDWQTIAHSQHNLFVQSWTNPHPDRVIKDLTVRVLGQSEVPLILAVTTSK